MPTFTTRVPDLRNFGPIFEIHVSVSSTLEDKFRQQKQKIPAPVSITAMVDTGASGTVLRQDIPSLLHLQPVGETLINTPSSTNVRCYKYLTRLLLPENVTVETVAVAAPLQGQNIQCLLGRDVLQHSVLVYIGHDNSFTLSF